jgi:hypothetical protein
MNLGDEGMKLLASYKTEKIVKLFLSKPELN